MSAKMLSFPLKCHPLVGNTLTNDICQVCLMGQSLGSTGEARGVVYGQ